MAKTRLLVLLFMSLVVGWVPLPAAADSAAERVIHITAESFAFTPEIIRVRRGDTVTIDLASLDATHGIYLDGYDLSVVAEPGRPARLTLVADRAGSFRFRCSVACGNLHPFMIGQLKVGPNLQFWRGLAAMAVVVLGGLWFYGRRVH
jgi:heme/copper-type cytochrome/quinol oxidase subunit 2